MTSTWPQIESNVLAILHNLDWLALSVLRRGTSHSLDENPVTIVITINEEDNDDWFVVRDSIVELLDQKNLLDVAVEMERLILATHYREIAGEQRLTADVALGLLKAHGIPVLLEGSSSSNSLINQGRYMA